MAMTPNLQVVREFAKANYSLSVGIFSCRKISDSQTYSQHSWSNAIDIFTANKGFQDKMASELKEEFGSHIRNILTWRFNAAHWNHIHVSMWPKGYLTPPCEGGQLRIKYKDGHITYGEPFPLTIEEEEMISKEEMDEIAATVWRYTIKDAPSNKLLHTNTVLRAIRNDTANLTVTITDADIKSIAVAVVEEQHRH